MEVPNWAALDHFDRFLLYLKRSDHHGMNFRSVLPAPGRLTSYSLDSLDKSDSTLWLQWLVYVRDRRPDVLYVVHPWRRGCLFPSTWIGGCLYLTMVRKHGAQFVTNRWAMMDNDGQ